MSDQESREPSMVLQRQPSPTATSASHYESYPASPAASDASQESKSRMNGNIDLASPRLQLQEVSDMEQQGSNMQDASLQSNISESDDELLESALASWSKRDEPSLLNVPDLDPSQQVAYIKDMVNNTTLEEGDTWYIIAKQWFSRWETYCTRMSSSSPATRDLGARAPPGPIDNSSILSNDDLKPHLIAEEHFTLVPEKAWNCLCEWYGAPTIAIPRQVITEGEHVKETVVEIYPPTFILCIVGATSEPTSSSLERRPKVTMSRKTTLAELETTVVNALDIRAQDGLQLWQFTTASDLGDSVVIEPHSLIEAEQIDLTHKERTVGDMSINGGVIAVETKSQTSGSFPSEEVLIRQMSDASSVSSASSVFAGGFNNLTGSSTTPLFSSASTYASNDAEPNTTSGSGSWSNKGNTPTKPRGVCGLSNLGNTCFMNAALQCMSNTPQLSEYFLSGKYKSELNRVNPLGMKGEVAEAYGALIEKLWSGTASSVAPRDFKYTISRFNPTFTGYMQHDSQELLAFLLDGLHEDLNRIIKKPYIELPDFDGMSDYEISERSWSYHKARNDSVIVDLFQGQFKSRLTCNECKKVSVTFDPFMYLSLPLPIQKKIKIELVYVPYDPSQRARRLTTTFKKDADINDLKNKVAELAGVKDPSTLLVVELFSGKIYKIFSHDESVANIGHNDTIYVYQLPGPVSEIESSENGASALPFADDDVSENGVVEKPADQEKLIVFPVYCEAVTDDDRRKTSKQFGGPMILAIKESEAQSVDTLYRLIVEHIERYAAIKLFEEVRQDDSLSRSNSLDDSAKTDDKDSGTAMEIDSPAPPQQPIHTAAAVTAAGGRRMEPMKNLFTMKAFSESRTYSREPNELFPTGLSSVRSSQYVDIKERAEEQLRRRQELEEGSLDHNDRADETDQKKEENGPDKELYDGLSDDDIVEDAASSYPGENGTSGSVIVRPQTPKFKVNGVKRSQPTAPVPKTVIQQGEGIVLEWRLKKAQEVFGTPSSQSSTGLYRAASDNASVNGDAWDDYEIMKDPAAFEDQNAKRDVTLADCLDEFTKEEVLSAEDLWYCPRCKTHQRACKKFDLWRLPEIVVVHLKRFSHSRTWRDKIDAYIDFPIEGLDLTDRVLSIENPKNVPEEDRLIYDLYAVDNHYGGLGGGHYTAYAQNWDNGKWYNFDDSHVTEVDANSVKTSAAYLLFYKRRRTGQKASSSSVEDTNTVDS